ncbi:MAG: hypothetical protein ACKE5M_07050 [Methylophilaceae bacterium]
MISFRQIPSTSAVFMLLGSLFSLFVALQGIDCYGMSCLGWSVGGWAITVAGYPWSLLDKLLIPESYYLSYEIKNALIADPTLQIHLWPKFIIRYLAFMLNCFILGYLLEKTFRFLKEAYTTWQHPD